MGSVFPFSARQNKILYKGRKKSKNCCLFFRNIHLTFTSMSGATTRWLDEWCSATRTKIRPVAIYGHNCDSMANMPAVFANDYRLRSTACSVCLNDEMGTCVSWVEVWGKSWFYLGWKSWVTLLSLTFSLDFLMDSCWILSGAWW